MNKKVYKSQFSGLSLNEWKELKNLERVDFKYLNRMQEKVRRFVTYYNRKLHQVSKKRFKDNAKFQLENIFELLIIKTEKTNLNEHLPEDIPIDPSLFNAGLFCFEAIEKFNSSNKLNFFAKKLDKYKKEIKLYLEKKYLDDLKNNKTLLNDFTSIFDYEKFRQEIFSDE